MGRRWGVLVVVLLLASCTGSRGAKDADPQARLQEYISKSFSVRKLEDKAELMRFLGGDARNRLEAWSEDQFLEAFVDAKRQFIKFRVLEQKPLSADQLNILYELSFSEKSRSGGPNSSEVKITQKLCSMNRLDGQWFIMEVRNIKELVEYRNELSLP